MSISHVPLLTSILIEPARLSELDELQWDLLVRQARSSNLLGRLSVMVRNLGLMENIPRRVQLHLKSEYKYFQAHRESVIWEIENIHNALQKAGIPVVLLKGAAYLKSELHAGEGRIFNDIDILVDQEYIQDAEKQLYMAGWLTTHLNDYDQKYYRKWMHELPPLKHYTRRTVLDVHHNILPVTASFTPESRRLLDKITPVDEKRMIYVLSPLDMIIHSATHLFHEGELNHGLRDLLDIDLLIKEHVDGSFWDQLVGRVFELNLVWPVYYALYFLHDVLLHPVPGDVLRRLRAGLKATQGSKIVRMAYRHAFLPAHPSCRKWSSGFAMWFLYIRGHKLRMPYHLLIPHLVRKAFMKEKNEI